MQMNRFKVIQQQNIVSDVIIHFFFFFFCIFNKVIMTSLTYRNGGFHVSIFLYMYFILKSNNFLFFFFFSRFSYFSPDCSANHALYFSTCLLCDFLFPLIKPSLRFSFYCVFFVSKGNLSEFYFMLLFFF